MDLSYFNFRDINEEDATKLIQWRTSPSVEQFMHTKINKDLEKQKKWILEINENKNICHKIIQVNQIDIGYVSIKIIDDINMIGTIGIYIGESMVSRELTAFNFIPILNHVFFSMELNVVKNQILGNNKRLLKAQKFNGYNLVRKENKIINNNIVEIYYYEQNKINWNNYRKKFNWYKGF